MVTTILSFLPLQVGYGSRDAFVGVNRQWSTYVRDIKRPCIEWIGGDDKKKGSNAWSLIVSKYPNAINAISLENLPINAIESLVNISPSSIATLRSLLLPDRPVDYYKVIDLLDTIAITTVHGVFRSVNLDKGNGKMRGVEAMVGIAHVASQLLSSYNATNKDDEEGLRSRHGQVPIIKFNGLAPVKCSHCSAWTWELSKCNDCGAPHRACCEVTWGQCGVCETGFATCSGHDDELAKCGNTHTHTHSSMVRSVLLCRRIVLGMCMSKP
jgi:hypothetical protein